MLKFWIPPNMWCNYYVKKIAINLIFSYIVEISNLDIDKLHTTALLISFFGRKTELIQKTNFVILLKALADKIGHFNNTTC